MAKSLYLVRHAKSSWTDTGLGDFDRPLNKRGLRDAPEMGRRLNLRNVHPEIILCSPARRTRETLDLLIGKTAGNVHFKQAIYEASDQTLLSLVRTLPDSCTSAMLIGHNPAMGWLVRLCIEGSAKRKAMGSC